MSVPSHDEEASIIFLEEKTKQAAANNLLRKGEIFTDTSRMQNATLPVMPLRHWKENPNPEPADLIPEHVAILIHTKTNVLFRTLFFWEQHDPWMIVQAVLHDDVIIKPRPANEETDMLIDSSLMRIAEDGQMIPYPPASLRGEDEQIPLVVQEQAPNDAEDNQNPPAEEAIPPSNEATHGSSTQSSSEIETSQSSGSSSVVVISSSSSGQSFSDAINATNEGIDDNLLTSPEQNSSNTLAESTTGQAKGNMGEREEQGDHA